jgi:acetyl-CoA carboxylase carboxyl transferase subunit beta
MMWFGKPKYSTVSIRQREIPKDVWTKCPVTGELVFNKDLQQNCMVVPNSGYHFPLDASRRVELLCDVGTFVEMDVEMRSVDPLNFVGPPSYMDKLQDCRERTSMADAVIWGKGCVEDIPVILAVMDFRFLGASMGSVVGEKITRAIERSAREDTPLIVVATSGGARIYEGVLSLMQMAKTSAALARLAARRVPYISVLTNPTMAGVMASFASLGDVILAEPGALIGFAGPRVIKDTTQQELPQGFQTAEFLLEHGLIDQIVSRRDLKSRLTFFLKAFGSKRGKD